MKKFIRIPCKDCPNDDSCCGFAKKPQEIDQELPDVQALLEDLEKLKPICDLILAARLNVEEKV